MKDVYDIALAIECNDFTMDELRRINGALKRAYERTQSQAKDSLSIGQRVQFTDHRYGTVVGTITKIMRKNVQLNVDGANWRVSPSLLTRV